MAKWRAFEEMAADLLNEFELAKKSGATDEAAIARVSALLAVHRDDIINPSVSYGLSVAILRSVADVVDPGGTRH